MAVAYRGELSKLHQSSPSYQTYLNKFMSDVVNSSMSKPLGVLEDAAKLVLSGINCAGLKRFDIEEMRSAASPVLIGFGSYGRIWKVVDKQLGAVALKQQSLKDSGSFPDIWKERDVLLHIKGPRICNLLGAFHSVDSFLVLELCHGSITTYRGRITPVNAARFIFQLLDGIKWIHAKGIIHADLTPDNCLINCSNNLVLSDFGSAILDLDDAGASVVSVGSPGYMDYDVLQNLIVRKQSDLFSAACVVFELDTKSAFLHYDWPEQSRNLYIDAFRNGRIVGLRPGDDIASRKERQLLADRAMCSNYGKLIKGLIADHSERLTAEDALGHPNLTSLLKDFHLSPEDIDYCDQARYVTKEFNYDCSVEFGFLGDSSTTSLPMNLAMIALIYDGEPEETTNSDCGGSNDSNQSYPTPLPEYCFDSD